MRSGFCKLYFRLQQLMMEEEGQDLIEFALVASMISLAAIGTIRPLANGINALYNNVSTALKPFS